MNKLIRSTLVGLCALMLAAASFGAEGGAPQRWLVTTYEPEPGMQMQHEMLARRYVAAADAIDWERPWFVSATILSDTPRYVVAIPVDSMAMFGTQPNILAEAEGPDAMAEVLEIASETYEHVSSGMAVHRPDLGIAPPERDGPPVGYWSIRVKVKPGGEQAYQDYLRAIVEASDEQYWNLFQGGFGSAGWWVANIPVWDWADLDQPPGPGIAARLREQFGDRRGGRIYADGSALIEEMHVDLMRWRWDLSWMPQAGN